MPEKSTANADKIDVYALSAESRTFEASYPVASMACLAGLLADASGQIEVSLTGTRGAKGMPGAVMTLSGLLNLSCTVCGKPVVFSLEREVPFLFAASESALNAIPIEDDMGYEITVGSRSFDVKALAEEEAILSLPAFPKHRGCRMPVARDEEEARNRIRPFAGLKKLISS